LIQPVSQTIGMMADLVKSLKNDFGSTRVSKSVGLLKYWHKIIKTL